MFESVFKKTRMQENMLPSHVQYMDLGRQQKKDNF